MTIGLQDAERRSAVRALLRNPLLPATAEAGEAFDTFVLIRRHSNWLKEWFAKFPAWTLHVDRDVARLRKLPPDFLDETRPAVDRATGTAFSKRTYVFLCLALGALERADQETTLLDVARTISEFIAADPNFAAAGLAFDTANYDQRRDLVHAIRYLVDSGAIERIDGDELPFLERTEAAYQNVLYRINRPVLATMLNVSRSASALPSQADSIAERASKLIGDPLPEDEDERGQQIRSRLVRALLDDPVVYFDELSEDERHYLEQHRSYLLRQIYEATGLTAEVRREGVALVDDTGQLTDNELLEESADSRRTLRVIAWLATHCRTSPSIAIPYSHVDEFIHAIDAPEDTLMRIRALRLIRFTKDGIVPLAACGRYAAAEGEE